MNRRLWWAILLVACGPAETRFFNFDKESMPPGSMQSGWSYFERNDETLDTFVWVEGQEAQLRVISRVAGDRLVRFRGVPYQYSGALPQIAELWINGRAVETLPLADTMRVYSIRTPGDAWVSGKNELKWVFSHAAKPSEKEPASRDGRSLSFSFDWVEIQPVRLRP